MVHVPVGTIMRDLEMAKPSIMSRKVLLENGHIPGTGLGLHGQDIEEPIQVSKWRKMTGLDYQGGNSGDRDSHGGRDYFGARGQHGGRDGCRGHVSYGSQRSNKYHGNHTGLANHGSCEGQESLFGLGEGQKSLLPPELKEIFPGPPNYYRKKSPFSVSMIYSKGSLFVPSQKMKRPSLQLPLPTLLSRDAAFLFLFCLI